MKFKVDENLPDDIATDLRAAGHEADTVGDEGLTGSADAALMARVLSEGRALLTLDKGMADIRKYPPAQYGGIVLFRPRSTGPRATLAFVRKHLGHVLQLDLAGHLAIITDAGIRIL